MIIELNSVGSVINTQTLLVYPMFNDKAKLLYNKEYDETCHTHLNECGGDWLTDLSEEDVAVIKIYSPNFNK